MPGDGDVYAVFARNVARPPSGLQLMLGHVMRTVDEQLARQHSLDDIYERHAPRKGKKVELGDSSGFIYDQGPFCHFAADALGVSALLRGQVSEWPGVDSVAKEHDAYVTGQEPTGDAAWLLQWYTAFSKAMHDDHAVAALSSLSSIRGSFAFIIYDSLQRQVLAARDAQGAQPLFWGATEDGRFLISSSYNDLADCYPSATPFPAGSLYASERSLLAISPGAQGFVIPGQPWPGRVLSFVKSSAGERPYRHIKAIPRITSKGCLCGSVFRVESEINLVNTSTAVAGEHEERDTIRVEIA